MFDRDVLVINMRKSGAIATGRRIRSITSRFINVTRVDMVIHWCVPMQDLAAMANACPNIAWLDLRWERPSPHASACLEAMFNNGLSKLKRLELQNYATVTDDALKAMARKCGELTEMTIGYAASREITDVGMEALANGCRKLKEVTITNVNFGITGKGLIALAKGCKDLKRIEVQCKKIVDLWCFQSNFEWACRKSFVWTVDDYPTLEWTCIVASA
jgi:hypothetical protein